MLRRNLERLDLQRGIGIRERCDGAILALTQEVQHWSLTSIRDRLVKISVTLVSHARYATFQMAVVAVPRGLFRSILANIADLRYRKPSPC